MSAFLHNYPSETLIYHIDSYIYKKILKKFHIVDPAFRLMRFPLDGETRFLFYLIKFDF